MYSTSQWKEGPVTIGHSVQLKEENDIKTVLERLQYHFHG